MNDLSARRKGLSILPLATWLALQLPIRLVLVAIHLRMYVHDEYVHRVHIPP